MNRLIAILLALTLQGAALAQTPEVRTYEKALDLVHAYSGSGPELRQAMTLAEELSRTAPKSGYSQVLQAEAMSTWALSQEGQPAELRNQVIGLADEALGLNPQLAQAHVSKARALVRASMYEQACTSIDAALAMDPKLSGAIFLGAEVFRRRGEIANADIWYRKFIDSTVSKSRKANGYAWIGSMYQDASWNDDVHRAEYVAKARAAYESMLTQNSDGAWRNVNFAVFLNEYADDYDAAERYAAKALRMMEFPMARYHLAAARYQKLSVASSSMTSTQLQKAVKNVAGTTGISLQDAIAFDAFSQRLVGRLTTLQGRIAAR